MIKLYYTEDKKLLYSRNWPEVPPVQASIYKETFMMNEFNRQMDFHIRHGVEVTNADDTKGEIVWSGHRIEPGKFYEIPCEVIITSSNTCEVITTLKK